MAELKVGDFVMSQYSQWNTIYKIVILSENKEMCVVRANDAIWPMEYIVSTEYFYKISDLDKILLNLE